MSKRQVLVVDDEPKMQRILEIMLHKMGHDVLLAADGQAALQLAQSVPIDLVLTDLRMPGMDGVALLTALREHGIEAPVIVLTAHGTVESAVAAMKSGAYDYILRPFDVDAVEIVIRRALALERVQRENRFLREEVEKGWGEFIGRSAAMQQQYELIRQVAGSNTSVLILGESGTGKELAARAIHRASPRREALFVPLNCAAIPPDLLESELFGHSKGAFTGAVKERVGKFEMADGDEWGLFVQGTVPLSARTFAIGRYEFFDLRGLVPGVHLWVAGLAFRPLPPLVLRAEYSFARDNVAKVPEGFATSVALLF